MLLDFGKLFLPNHKSDYKSNHKYLSDYLKFVYNLRQQFNIYFAMACFYIFLTWSLFTVTWKMLGKWFGKTLRAQIIDVVCWTHTYALPLQMSSDTMYV